MYVRVCDLTYPVRFFDVYRVYKSSRHVADAIIGYYGALYPEILNYKY